MTDKDEHWFIDTKPTIISRGMIIPVHWKAWLFLVVVIGWCFGFVRLADRYSAAGKPQEAFVCGLAVALGVVVCALTVAARSKRL
ncbi:MAG: hypothetical protein QM647_13835 [Asticcacaulis sp.]|uniref:hypothetical protein n=1 Tax=Asticcacaulis sp. TaxID=1872648 RepID=UPI0039E3EBBB